VYPVARVADGLWRVRMFAPGIGVAEDPATGSAAAAFAGWIAKRSGTGDGTLRLTLHQGLEIGRPSELRLEIDRAHGATTAVRVGGAAVLVGEGRLYL
jgi:trans-2,3-dihydro-3-hydroxyanthranilate isomerase